MNKKLTFISAAAMIAGSTLAQDNLKVNQVGYYPNEQKIAVVEPAAKQTSFTIKDAKGKTVWSGKASRTSVSPFNGKERQVVDFSSLTKPGAYTFYAGKSRQAIVIRDHAMADVATAAMKSFYLQRTATAIEAKYAGEYARPAAHMDDKVLIHPSAASPGRPAGTVISSPWGWYDAGDFNKYIVNSGFSIGVMLQGYQVNKAYIDGMNLNIPESTNDTPDYLDEIMYNLKWMLTMQDPYDGGVYHKLTTPNFEGFVMPVECKQQRYVVQKSTEATLDFAATMALAARIYGKLPQYSQWAADATKAAERAYAWAVKNPAMHYDQDDMNKKFTPQVNTGTYGDGNATDEFFWAATELYLTTQQNAYLEQAAQFKPAGYAVPTWGEVSGLGVQQWIIQSMQGNNVPASIGIDQMKASLIDYGKTVASRIPTSSFHCPHGNIADDFQWGSNSEKCAGQGIALLFAYNLTGDKTYKDAALCDADYLMGKNATGYCFVTGFGTKQVMHPHQRLSEADGIAKPLPGFLAGGPNPGQQDKQYVKTYPSSIPDESYTDDMASYASNEIAINWNAYLVAFLTWLDAKI